MAQGWNLDALHYFEWQLVVKTIFTAQNTIPKLKKLRVPLERYILLLKNSTFSHKPFSLFSCLQQIHFPLKLPLNYTNQYTFLLSFRAFFFFPFSRLKVTPGLERVLHFGRIGISAGHLAWTLSVWNEWPCLSLVLSSWQADDRSVTSWARIKCKLTRDEALVAEYNAGLCLRVPYYLVLGCWRGGGSLRKE